ncbi:putative voltage-dependent anion channel [Lupinus albus]|uniref:Putative voltage-dependent anion channel n=1 Tax=Lupinus albus TaxID=3870 RepID=A0A6A4NDI1_LUPAL|nr:putative voltage-dependent anion channel [Lupinus albus]
MSLIINHLAMPTQPSKSEIEIVIDMTTSNVTSHNISTNNIHESSSFMMITIAKRLLMSLSSILTKFHAGYFRISLSLCGQALLWKTLIGPTHDTKTLRNVLGTLHPTIFLVLWDAPSVASLAWASILGVFDIASKMLFFLSLFLFMSLICRPALFKRSMRRFNVAWWAYSYPVTVLAMASIDYAEEVKGTISHLLMLLLLILSFLVSLALMLFTLLNSNMLLPDNDPIVNKLAT